MLRWGWDEDKRKPVVSQRKKDKNSLLALVMCVMEGGKQKSVNSVRRSKHRHTHTHTTTHTCTPPVCAGGSNCNYDVRVLYVFVL